MTGRRGALVTGAGTGIGLAVAERLAADGFVVACAGRRREPCEETVARIHAAGGNALAVIMDVRDREAVDRGVALAASELGSLDVLVNNAGAGGPNDLADAERWRVIVDTNLTGTYLVTRAAVPRMSPGGRVVNIASVLARFGVPGYTAYCASKAGVLGLTRALALELAPQGISVNAICPGWVATAMAREGMEAGARAQGISLDAFHRQAMEKVPLGRMLEPSEVAALVAFLTTPDAAGMTGQGIDFNGGSFMA